MGQQQLLLLVLGAIIVGVAIVIGINMFAQNALTANVDAVKQDCLTIISKAQQWYRTPAPLGGPTTHHTFTGLDFSELGYGSTLTDTYSNQNGYYVLTDGDQQFTLEAYTVERENTGTKLSRLITFTNVTPTTVPTASEEDGT